MKTFTFCQVFNSSLSYLQKKKKKQSCETEETDGMNHLRLEQGQALAYLF